MAAERSEKKALLFATDFKPFGVIGGTLKGIADAMIDASGGLINTLTCFVDNE